MKSNHARAAQMIRRELKERFPGVKFSIRSRSYSGGSAVDIRSEPYVDRQEVMAIVGKYQYGHFDGMTDTYHHSNTDESIPQVQFVQYHRSY